MLTLRLEAPRAVREGESVELVLHVGNPTAREVRVGLAAGPDLSFDPLVTRPGGPLVWRRWRGLWAGPAGEDLVLPPAAGRAFRATWDLRDLDARAVPPGEYEVHARLLAEGGRVLSPPDLHRITVRPRRE